MIFYVAITFFVSALAGCMPKQKLSSTKGSFEVSSPESLRAFAGKLRPIAEYEPYDFVTISRLTITEYFQTPFVESLLQNTHLSFIRNSRGGPDSGNPIRSEEERQSWKDWGKNIADDFRGLNEEQKSRVYGVNYFPTSNDGIAESSWSRDYSPIMAEMKEPGSNKKKLVLVEFNYQNRRDGDSLARVLEKYLPEMSPKYSNVSRVSIPIYLDGGNFLVNSLGDCFATDIVYSFNAEKIHEDDILYSEDEIENFFTEIIGCRNFNVVPTMPFEVTGHIDMFMKFFDDTTLVINEIDDETIDSLRNYVHNNRERLQQEIIDGEIEASVDEYYVGRNLEIKKWLDDIAVKISSQYGNYKIIRIPMPPKTSRLTRTYANSLIVNQKKDSTWVKKVFVPSYRSEMIIDAEAMEQKIKGILETIGYQVFFSNTDQTIQSNGAIHCITSQIGF